MIKIASIRFTIAASWETEDHQELNDLCLADSAAARRIQFDIEAGYSRISAYANAAEADGVRSPTLLKQSTGSDRSSWQDK